LFAQENKKQRKKISKAIEKKEEKNNCLSSFHTRGLLRDRLPLSRITTTARQRERRRDRDRDFVVVVAKKKKKTTRGFERERSDAREKTKRTVSVWGNSI
jgi:ribosomal protein S14